MLPGFSHGYSGNWHTQFRANIVLDILLGLVPLLAGACVQRLLRFLKWRVWIQSIVAGAICGIMVGLFYFYALYPIANWALAESEGVGNDLDKYWGAVSDFGVFGGIGTVASTFATSVLIRHRAS